MSLDGYCEHFVDDDVCYQETVPIDVQVQHLGQKYTGIRPETHTQAMFKATDAQASGNHPVPISNFMNAQCKHCKY